MKTHTIRVADYGYNQALSDTKKLITEHYN